MRPSKGGKFLIYLKHTGTSTEERPTLCLTKTIWRIMCHDIQHGGQLAQMLGMQGLDVPELGELVGHLTEPPVVEG